MKKLALGLWLSLAIFTTTALQAQDLTGTWTFEYDVIEANGECAGEENDPIATEVIGLIHNTQTGEVTVSGIMGDSQVIVDGTVSGSTFSFSASFTDEGGTTNRTIQLEILNANTMSDTIDQPGEEWTWGPTATNITCEDGKSFVNAFRQNVDPSEIAVSGHVWIDVDDNGIEEASDQVLSNITVILLQGQTVVSNSVTDSEGNYSFPRSGSLVDDTEYTIRLIDISNALESIDQIGSERTFTLHPTSAQERDFRYRFSDQTTFIGIELPQPCEIILPVLNGAPIWDGTISFGAGIALRVARLFPDVPLVTEYPADFSASSMSIQLTGDATSDDRILLERTSGTETSGNQVLNIPIDTSASNRDIRDILGRLHYIFDGSVIDPNRNLSVQITFNGGGALADDSFECQIKPQEPAAFAALDIVIPADGVHLVATGDFNIRASCTTSDMGMFDIRPDIVSWSASTLSSAILTHQFSSDGLADIWTVELVNPGEDQESTADLLLTAELGSLTDTSNCTVCITGCQDPPSTLEECFVQLLQTILFGFGELLQTPNEAPEPNPLPGLFSVRDLLNTSEEGRRLTDLYNTHSTEATQMLFSSPGLAETTQVFLDAIKPGITAILSGKGDEVIITQEMADALNNVRSILELQASPAFLEDLRKEAETFNGMQDFVGMSFGQALAEAEVDAADLSITAYKPIQGVDTFSVSCYRVDGLSYSLWKRPSLSSGEWVLVEAAVESNDELRTTLTDPSPGGASAFYRIQSIATDESNE